mgnify:CR=1 FL=1
MAVAVQLLAGSACVGSVTTDGCTAPANYFSACDLGALCKHLTVAHAALPEALPRQLCQSTSAWAPQPYCSGAYALRHATVAAAAWTAAPLPPGTALSAFCA